MTEVLVKISAPLRLRIAEVPLVFCHDLKKGPSEMRLARTLRDYLRPFGRGPWSRKANDPGREQV